MEKLIACCGLDCTTCDAYKATMLDDNDLRAKTAAIWREQFSPDITDEMINCTGCRQEGAKFAHCFQCEIRKCVATKQFQTCADCDQLENCDIVGNILKHVPEARENLRSLN